MDPDLLNAVELLTPSNSASRKDQRAWKRERQLARRECRTWLNDPGTIGFGVGYRETLGRIVEEPTLRVHVLRKLPRSRLGKAAIPPVLRLSGLKRPIAVDVVEGNIGRLQRAMFGDGVRLAGLAGRGTIGCLVRRGSSPQIYMLTCRHVLDGALGGNVEWLEFPPAPAAPNPIIGTLDAKSTLLRSPGFPNRTDAALVRVANGAIEPAVRRLGRINGIRTTPLVIGEKVRLCGFGTSLSRQGNFDGVTEGSVKEVASRQVFDYPGVGVVGFADLVLCQPFTVESDSGAAVLDAQDRLVGMHLGAGSSATSGIWSAFLPIANVFALQNLTLASPSSVGQAPAGSASPRSAPPVGHRATAIDIMARTIWGEARGESSEGRVGVANVIVNRAVHAPPRYGGTVEQVCHMPKQFSCWNNGDPNRPKMIAVTTSNAAFAECLEIARKAVDGSLEDNTFGSRHYHAKTITPSFTTGHSPVVRLGKHSFYNSIV